MKPSPEVLRDVLSLWEQETQSTTNQGNKYTNHRGHCVELFRDGIHLSAQVEPFDDRKESKPVK